MNNHYPDAGIHHQHRHRNQKANGYRVRRQARCQKVYHHRKSVGKYYVNVDGHHRMPADKFCRKHADDCVNKKNAE